MFFIASITPKQRILDFNQTTICPNCGKYGRYSVYMEYMCFSLFFIPIIKWNKKFYAKSSCCESIFSIDNETGERILRGENVNLNKKSLELLKIGKLSLYKKCENCGYSTNEDFQYCPKCSRPLHDLD